MFSLLISRLLESYCNETMPDFTVDNKMTEKAFFDIRRYLKNCEKSLFLNSPNLRIDFTAIEILCR